MHFKQLIQAARDSDILAMEQQLNALHSMSEQGKFPAELYEA